MYDPHDDYDTMTAALQLLLQQGQTTVTVYGRTVAIKDVLAGIRLGITESLEQMAEHTESIEDSDAGDWLMDPSQQAELDNVETRLYVETYLALLNSDQETVVRLHYGIGGQPPLELEEIAEELFMGIDYVRRNLSEGQRYLKFFMEHDQEFETDPIDPRYPV